VDFGSAWFDWPWRPGPALVVFAAGGAYVHGWCRLRRQGYRQIASLWRVGAYLAGLASVVLALMSPIEQLAHVLFSAHMVQHQLLLMVAPPCLLLGNPFPLVIWALPRGTRRALQGALTQASPLRQALRRLTWLPVAGLLYAVNLWAWHLPAAYEAALGSPVLHDVEHLAFFGTAILFWWPIVNPAPRCRWPRPGGLYYGLRIAYLVLATAQNTLLGAVIGLTERVLYPSYARASGLFGLTPLDDQALGGGIMWSGGHMYLIAILALVAQAMNAGEREQPEPALPRDRAGS
jgi:cytochrome c oxidase assembly factor CtaG